MQGLTLPLQFINLVKSWLNQGCHIFTQLIRSCNTSMVVLGKAYCFLASLNCMSRPLQMQVGLPVQIQGDPLLVIVSLWLNLWSLGSLRSNKQPDIHQHNQNIGQWLLQCVRLYGWSIFFRTFKFVIQRQLCFLVIAKLHYQLLLYFMREQSILR